MVQPQQPQQSTCSNEHNSSTGKKKSAIRHAEKRRTSTCKFADRVAQLSVQHYKSIIPIEKHPPQTCIATILAHYACTDRNADDDGDSTTTNNNNDSEGKLQVLSMGIGTKFLSESCLRQEIENESYGSRVRDMHAEVLAQRAFRRQLTLEILFDLEEQSKSMKIDRNNNNNNSKKKSILVRSSNIDGDGMTRYKLRQDITLHMYTSSAPCGNATLKKFCKMSKEQYREDLGPDEWPNLVHEKLPGHSIKLGEFALLLKRDNSKHSSICINVVDETPANSLSSSLSSLSNTTTMGAMIKKKRTKIEDSLPQSKSQEEIDSRLIQHPTKYEDIPINQPQQQQHTSSKSRIKPWPANLSDDWTPPGTTIVGFRDKGSIHTCSDKICRWNYLGIQGSLLVSLLEEPLYLSTMTVGRKLSGSVCRRAICCRLDTRFRQPILTTTSKEEASTSNKKYRINHPAVLGTSVYLNTGVVETSNTDGGVGQDVRFHSSISWAWWLGSDESNNTGMLECIESTSGLLANSSLDRQRQKQQGMGLGQNIMSNIVAPRVSTKELTLAFLQAYNLATNSLCMNNNNNNNNYTTNDGMKPGEDNEFLPFSTLTGLRRVKTMYSPAHEQFKNLVLTKHKVLSHWQRRTDSKESM